MSRADTTDPGRKAGQPTSSAAELAAELQSAVEDVGRARNLTFPVLGALIVAFGIWAVRDGGGQLLLQRTFDGLNNGFVYSAMALSLVLIYRSTGVINFAQGNMAMFGTFIAYVLVVEQGMPIVAGIGLAMVISAAGAAVIERLTIWPFDPSDHLPIIIVTLAWYLIFSAVAAIIWAFDPRAFPTPFPTGADDFVEISGARIQYSSLGIWVTVTAAVVAVSQLLQRTKIGLAFRAVSSNLDSARLVGIRISRTVQLGWALAAAVGTLAGCLIAPKLLLEPGFMSRVLVYAFAAATLGGLDSLGGAVVGGLLIGLVQTMAGGYIPWVGSEFAMVSALVVIVFVLLVRPNGLFGARKVERV